MIWEWNMCVCNNDVCEELYSDMKEWPIYYEEEKYDILYMRKWELWKMKKRKYDMKSNVKQYEWKSEVPMKK